MFNKKLLLIFSFIGIILFSGCLESQEPSSIDSEVRNEQKREKQKDKSDECVIKGNIGFESGEKIYHVPGQEYYNKTEIDTSEGERWFCTEKEAIDAGWRKSKL